MSDQNAIQCPLCGQRHPAGLVYCPNTGRPIPMGQVPPPPVFPQGNPPGYGQSQGQYPPPVFPQGSPPGQGQYPPPPVFPQGSPPGYGQNQAQYPPPPGYGQAPSGYEPPPGYYTGPPAPPPAARRGVPALVWALLAMVVIGVAGFAVLRSIGGFSKTAEPLVLPTFNIPTINIPTLPPLPTLALPTFSIPTLPPIPTINLFPTSASQATRTPSPTPWPTVTPDPGYIEPRTSNFRACAGAPCKSDGSNAVASFPEKTTTIYLQWRYENIPYGAHYIRRWTRDGKEWVRYDCTWPGPSSGVDDITLTEPNGLASGTWIISILVDGREILHDFVRISGSWSYWDPAGTFNSCYGKK